jgi:ubiquinone/menaquinone biosynthesis C-methylase UbiE
MALIAPTNFDKADLQEKVRATYEEVAKDPEGDFHFHRGAEYAAEYLGYNVEDLEKIPKEASDRFAGVGNPVDIGDSNPVLGGIRAGQVVLDHACGAGMDLLLAAHRVGITGKAIGVDMTEGMRNAAQKAAQQSGLGNIVDIREGVFEDLPVESSSVDVVISNGVVNLAPDKVGVFEEIYRVLKPGGLLFMADVVVQRELTLEARENSVLWAACVGGALVESELYLLAKETGFQNGAVVKRFNCFYNTTAEDKVAKDLFVHAVNFVSMKPIN